MRRLRTGKFELNDYDFQQSGSDLTARAEEGFPKAKTYEAYDYPGELHQARTTASISPAFAPRPSRPRTTGATPPATPPASTRAR